MAQPEVIVVGAGVCGLACALVLAERGAAVRIVERGARLGADSCSWMAGGMLAPWCERASTEAAVMQRGIPALGWWTARFPGTVRRGSLVVAAARDLGELERFARRTERFAWCDAAAIARLEPALAGRFGRALHFAEEGHLDPRAALAALERGLAARGIAIEHGMALEPAQLAAQRQADWIVDCRGLAARPALPDLRGVRGEMLVVRSDELRLARPVRLLHPRLPLYVVPRDDGRCMIGATMIETERRGPVSVRSALELLGAAFALHPAFGEAEIVELGADLRPAFPDNLPAVRRDGRVLHANGLFRHGFLLAPALAGEVADHVLGAPHTMETDHADLPQRRRT